MVDLQMKGMSVAAAAAAAAGRRRPEKRRPRPKAKGDHAGKPPRNGAANKKTPSGAPEGASEGVVPKAVLVFKQRLLAILETRGLSGRAFADALAAMIARSHPDEAAHAPSRSTVNRWLDPDNDHGPWLVHMTYIAECLDTTLDAILDESIPVDALPRRGESPEHAQLAAEEQEILKLARHLKRDEAIRRLMLASITTTL